MITPANFTKCSSLWGHFSLIFCRNLFRNNDVSLTLFNLNAVRAQVTIVAILDPIRESCEHFNMDIKIIGLVYVLKDPVYLSSYKNYMGIPRV